MFLIVLVILFIVFLVLNVHVVPQAHCYIVERLGVYHATWNAGLHLLIPVLDRVVKKISLK